MDGLAEGRGLVRAEGRGLWISSCGLRTKRNIAGACMLCYELELAVWSVVTYEQISTKFDSSIAAQ